MPDPIIVSSDFTTYPEKGLTWISDLASVHPRDTAGNIILQESSSNNPLLIIEPVKFDFTVASVKKVIETRFNFFQFPVTTVAGSGIDEINTDIGDVSGGIPEIDPITTKFTVPLIIDRYEQPGDGTNYARIGTSYRSLWYYSNTPDSRKSISDRNDANAFRSLAERQAAGELIREQQGYTRIPFDTSDGQGGFEITDNMIQYAKRNNKFIKFKIFVQLEARARQSYDNTSLDTNGNNANGMNTTFKMRLTRNDVYFKRGAFNGTELQPVLMTEDTGRKGNDPRTNAPWKLYNAENNNAAGLPLGGLFGENPFPEFYLEYVIDPKDVADGYKYFVEMTAGSPSWILTPVCRWDVIAVEPPNQFALVEAPIPGVLDIGSKLQLQNGLGTAIGNKADKIFTSFVKKPITLTPKTIKDYANQVIKTSEDVAKATKKTDPNLGTNGITTSTLSSKGPKTE